MSEQTDPTEQGYLGAVPDTIENDAYTLKGQGADTAKREREQREALRAEQIAASQHEEAAAPAPKTTKSSSSSGSSSS